MCNISIRIPFVLIYSLSSLIYLHLQSSRYFFFFFFNDPATTEIYTLSLHDALPIYPSLFDWPDGGESLNRARITEFAHRSEEHTSELQSRLHLVCRLLLEKKKKRNNVNRHPSTSSYRSCDARN